MSVGLKRDVRPNKSGSDWAEEKQKSLTHVFQLVIGAVKFLGEMQHHFPVQKPSRSSHLLQQHHLSNRVNHHG